ncbi:MAG: ribonuclease HII, partial [Candidatus Woesearchaeota archaeon]|nr:ribonuclease HII [Candidatus Woesearchaeota archaeon]
NLKHKPNIILIDGTHVPKNMGYHFKTIIRGDEKIPAISAASIIAKVTRDDAIEELKKKVGIDFGNGYPSDPKTKAFLEKYWDKHPAIFRKSWAPYKKMIAAQKQQSLDSFK